jgi:hypothetical protein
VAGGEIATGQAAQVIEQPGQILDIWTVQEQPGPVCSWQRGGWPVAGVV